MKKQLYIEDLRPGDHLTELFLVRSSQVNTGRTGSKYISLTLVDRSGQVDGKVWDNVDATAKSYEEGDVVSVSAEANLYQGQLQLRVTKLKRMDPGAVDMSDFVPTSPVDPDAMLAALKELLDARLADPHFRGLVEALFADRELVREFSVCTGGKAIHHAYRGGLLEHTLSMVRIAALLCDHYGPLLNQDLLLTGTTLHDLGKVRELTGLAAYDYTEEGRLVGHLAIGIGMIDDLAAKVPGFPTLYVNLLKHMVASHHGTPEFGALKEPSTMEAMVLSHIDDLDARVNSFASVFATMGEGEAWSGYQRLYNRYLFNWREHPEARGMRPAGDDAPRREPPPRRESAAEAEDMPQARRESARVRAEEPLKAKLDIPPGLMDLFGKTDKNQ